MGHRCRRGALQDPAVQVPVRAHDTVGLRHRLQQSAVDSAPDEWRVRLCASLWANDKHFEQLLWQLLLC